MNENEMTSIVDALSLLTPFDIDKSKVRVGPRSDGGYVFADIFDPRQTVVSYGIGSEWRLDLEFAERGHEVFMFDHTIAGIDTQHPRLHFFREGLAGRTNDTRRVYSIRDHLTRHKLDGRNLILKVDVEGDELEAFSTAPPEVFARLDQLVIELHQLDLLAEPRHRLQFCRMLRNINQHCTLFHVHANNFDGPDTFYVIDGVPVPRIIELSFVRTAAISRRPSQTLYPTVLDFPNTAQRDKLLWMFPFLPTTIPQEQFTICATRVANGWEQPPVAQISPPGAGWREQLELKETELQRIAAAGADWRRSLEEKETELQRISAAGAEWRSQLERKEAELQRVLASETSWHEQLERKQTELTRLYAADAELRAQLELKEAELQRILEAGAGWREQLERKEAELQRMAAVEATLRKRLRAEPSPGDSFLQREGGNSL